MKIHDIVYIELTDFVLLSTLHSWFRDYSVAIAAEDGKVVLSVLLYKSKTDELLELINM